MFVHKPLNFEEVNATTSESGRVYHTPVGDLPSVTTILGQRMDTSHLDLWRARIGIEAAEKVTTQASNRGTAVHNLAEKYLLNDPQWRRGAMPINVDTFRTIKPLLDNGIGDIYGLEVPLYSRRLNCAGRTDVLAQWYGVNSVIDFKTSKRVKDKSKILNYFLQATCYSVMLEEMKGLIFPQLVIVMMVDFDDPIVFVEPRDKYIEPMERIFIRD